MNTGDTSAPCDGKSQTKFPGWPQMKHLLTINPITTVMGAHTNDLILTWLALWSGEGNGTPLQYSYLENPMDEGAW